MAASHLGLYQWSAGGKWQISTEEPASQQPMNRTFSQGTQRQPVVLAGLFLQPYLRGKAWRIVLEGLGTRLMRRGQRSAATKTASPLGSCGAGSGYLTSDVAPG